MLHSAVSIATITAMVFHALLGCCWHHAHSSATSDGVGLIQSSQQCCPCSDHESDGSEEEHNGCDEPDCSFFADGRSEELSAPAHDLGSFVALGVSKDLGEPPVAGRRVALVAAHGFLSSPARRCAQTQVWRL